MYHAIVRRRVVALFAAVSKGDARPVLEGLAPHFEHFFLAIMPSVDRVSRWRKRDCGTSGSIGCCQTSVLTSAPSGFRDWLESNSGTDGVRTFTRGVHVVRLAWGRMTYIGIYPDTVGVVTTLQRLSRAGVAEATAEKIEG